VRSRSCALVTLVVVLAASVRVSAQPAPAPGDVPADQEAKKAEAKTLFEKGLKLYEQQAWDAALAEFMASRAAFPNRSATKNAALCLRSLGRFDESIQMFESLVREFPDLAEADRAFADRNITELRGLVGAVDVRVSEPGATIVVDGKSVGTSPAAPVRASAGTRVIRVYKEGFFPFDTRVEIAGGQTKLVAVTLTPLKRTGRLKVTEQTGRSVDVVIDGVVVGKTPWEGATSPGDHTLVLRGAWNEGTPPVAASVGEDQTTPLVLLIEELPASLRVEPTPASATVRVDGVVVGRGIWEGRLRSGAHQVEVRADGYVPRSFQVRLDESQHRIVPADLESEVAARPVANGPPSKFLLEVDVAGALSSSFGGVASTGCATSCDRSLGAGISAIGHAGYELPSGIGFGIAAGFLSIGQKRNARPAELTPIGRGPNTGQLDDALRLSGLVIGGSAGLHLGDRFPGLFRLGVGALIGSVSDDRTGNFETAAGTAYDTGTLSDSSGATFLYLAPEARVGMRLGKHVELSAGVAAMVLIALGRPEWQNDAPVLAAEEGQASFGKEPLVGQAFVVLTPGLGARYDF